MTKTGRFLLAIILLKGNLLSAQNTLIVKNTSKTDKDTLKKVSQVIAIQGDHTVNTITIGNFNCTNCTVNVLYSEKEKTITYSISNIIITNNNLVSIIDGTVKQQSKAKKALAQNIVRSSSTDQVASLANRKIEEESYRMDIDSNSVSLVISDVTDYDLEKYKLKVKYEPKENISRIKELGRYYYIDSASNPIKLLNGEAERYDTATDFINGGAIVGIQSPDMRYYLINRKGERSKYFFSEFEENFAGDSNVIKVTISNSDYLVSRDMYALTSGDSKIKSIYTYFTQAFNSGTSKQERVGLYSIQQGKIKEILPPKYWVIKPFGCNLVFIKSEKERKGKNKETEYQYGLLDLINDFKVIEFDNELTLLDSSTVGVRFRVKNFKRNCEGYFINKSRKLIPPQYSYVDHINKFGFMKACLGSEDQFITLCLWTYLNENGDRQLGYYDYLADEPDSFGLIKAGEGFTYHDKLGYIDTKDNVIVPLIYRAIGDFDNNGLVWAFSDIQFPYHLELLNRRGDQILDKFINVDFAFALDSIPEFSPLGFTTFGQKGYSDVYYTLVSNKGKVLVEHCYNKIEVQESDMKGIYYITDNHGVGLYVKNGERFPKGSEITNGKFRNGYLIGVCPKGGTCIFDTLGKRYPEEPYCMPYDSLSDVIKGGYVIATKGSAKGIVQIHTGEKYIDLLLDAITLEGDFFLCKKEDKSFYINTTPINKIFPFVKGDRDLYNKIVLNY